MSETAVGMLSSLRPAHPLGGRCFTHCQSEATEYESPNDNCIDTTDISEVPRTLTTPAAADQQVEDPQVEDQQVDDPLAASDKPPVQARLRGKVLGGLALATPAIKQYRQASAAKQASKQPMSPRRGLRDLIPQQDRRWESKQKVEKDPEDLKVDSKEPNNSRRIRLIPSRPNSARNSQKEQIMSN